MCCTNTSCIVQVRFDNLSAMISMPAVARNIARNNGNWLGSCWILPRAQNIRSASEQSTLASIHLDILNLTDKLSFAEGVAFIVSIILSNEVSNTL